MHRQLGRKFLSLASRDAPIEPRSGVRDKEVAQRLPQESQYLAAADFGLDEIEVIVDLADQPRLVFTLVIATNRLVLTARIVLLLRGRGKRRCMV
jgi:hypothetical protein